jgi:hypothetical protein
LMNKSKVMVFDALANLCADFYTSEEIEAARALLSSYVPHRLTKPKGGTDADRRVRTVIELLKCCLDSKLALPTFYSVNLNRLPPVGVEHIDVSALLNEVAALRAEVRSAVTLKNEIGLIRSMVAQLSPGTSDQPAEGSPMTSVNSEMPVVKSHAEVVREAAKAGLLNRPNSVAMAPKPSSSQDRVMRKAPGSKLVIGTSTVNKTVKSIDTVRRVNVFVSRLHPQTDAAELLNCVNMVKGELAVRDVACNKLKVKQEHLYCSYHVEIEVSSTDFKNAIDLFTSSEAWPTGLLVRRYFPPKLNNGNSE